MILADVIFPAPSAAYVASIFFPVAALVTLATELAVFAYFQRGIFSRRRIVGVVTCINMCS